MCQPDSTQAVSTDFWRPGDDVALVKGTGADIFRPDVYKVIEAKIAELDGELRTLSLEIHGAYACVLCCLTLLMGVCGHVDHPEIGFEEQ